MAVSDLLAPRARHPLDHACKINMLGVSCQPTNIDQGLQVTTLHARQAHKLALTELGMAL
jgi:hypothetical protein